jgi:hypothetical protein
MRLIGTAIICVVALYGIDSYWFNGMYFDAVRGVATQIKQHF